jgi:hypothetical protein
LARQVKCKNTKHTKPTKLPVKAVRLAKVGGFDGIGDLNIGPFGMAHRQPLSHDFVEDSKIVAPGAKARGESTKHINS